MADSFNGALVTVSNPIEIGGAHPSALGQATMANSLPVAIASNQSNVPTSINAYGSSLYSGSLSWTDFTDSQAIAGVAYTSPSATAKRVLANGTPRYWKWSTVCPVAGQQINIIQVSMWCDTYSTLPTTMELYLFSENPATAASANNSLLAVSYADMQKCIGVFAASSFVVLNTTSGQGNGAVQRIATFGQRAKLTTGNSSTGQDIYGVLVTTAAYTSTASENWKIQLQIGY